ncbi:MAG: MFS transporter, partial [Armatimonadetes bacterium]|nr:MFS transporter [Armatimonadota bacterium]
DRRGTGMGLFHGIEGVGLLIAGVVGGRLYEREPATAFLYGAALALTAAVLAWCALRPPREASPT